MSSIERCNVNIYLSSNTFYTSHTLLKHDFKQWDVMLTVINRFVNRFKNIDR